MAFLRSFVPSRTSCAGAKWQPHDALHARALVSNCVRFVFNLSQVFQPLNPLLPNVCLTWAFRLKKRPFHHHKEGFFKMFSHWCRNTNKTFPIIKICVKMHGCPTVFISSSSTATILFFLPVSSLRLLLFSTCLYLSPSVLFNLLPVSNFLPVSNIQLSLFWPPSSNPPVLSPTYSTCAAALPQTGRDTQILTTV